MPLKSPGKSISPEILNISSHGLWLILGDREYNLPFSQYPWFKKATVSQIQNMRLIHGHHLFWPDLDIDLALESLDNPENYPLIDRQSR